MAIRTIRSGIGTYQDTDGQWRHGVLGDEVDVHEDDLERFDRLNPPAPKDSEAELADEAHEEKFSQGDVDAAVKAAVDAKDAELAEATKALEDAQSALAELKAEKPKAPVRPTAKQP
ncbi:hypothetical protein ACTJI8_12835 [Microbacterium sp. 22303]|uniref:hypothetical protein n=1 Tax=Microbacterium sp. 22303 TaxID=3453905 RepID=UPI003F860396